MFGINQSFQRPVPYVSSHGGSRAVSERMDVNLQKEPKCVRTTLYHLKCFKNSYLLKERTNF